MYKYRRTFVSTYLKLMFVLQRAADVGSLVCSSDYVVTYRTGWKLVTLK